MKPKQIVIVTFALVALIAVVTYLKTNITTPLKQDGAPADPGKHVLYFPANTWPTAGQGEEPPPPPEYEWFQEGHHDFWFKNPTDRPIAFGLVRMNCKCSRVETALAPEGWVESPGQQEAAAAAQLGRAALGPLGVLAPTAAPKERDPAPGLTWMELKEDHDRAGAKGVTVPPGRGGWVRVIWKGKKNPEDRTPTKTERISAELWIQSPLAFSLQQRLEVNVTFVDPVRVSPANRERALEPLLPNDPPRKTAFVVWSTTRSQFKVTAEPMAEQQAKHPFVICGEPVALPREEWGMIEGAPPGKVLCAYRVPVTVYERKDGREQDIGPYRAVLTLTTDASDEPLHLRVGGVVKSDVTVVSDSNAQDRVQFAPFPSRFGATKRVVLEAPPSLGLEVEKFPDFMEVKLARDKNQVVPDRTTWTLTVRVLPNKVVGLFPQSQDAVLGDTAIYLKVRGMAERRLRIPVSGEATQ